MGNSFWEIAHFATGRPSVFGMQDAILLKASHLSTHLFALTGTGVEMKLFVTGNALSA